MATLKHTPGPWVVLDRHPTRACLRVTTQNDEHGYVTIASLFGAPDDDMEEEGADGIYRGDHRRVANAMLIAAAPEMLQLLRDAWDAYMCDPNPQALTATMNKVEELLSRLDGE